MTLRNAGQRDDPEHRPDRERLRRAQASSPDLADPNRPVFAINGVQVKIAGFPESKDAAPRGCDTAYVNTWACGPLKPNEMKTFSWSVTAVRAGDYRIAWRVNAGLDGKAKAVAQGGGPAPSGMLRRARSRTRRRRCAWPTTATRSSTGLADLLLVARAALHRYPRVLGEAVVGPVPEAHGEHASAPAAHDLLVRAAVAEARSHAGKASTYASKGSDGRSRSLCPMCEGRPQVDTP